jgi:ribosomal protein S18 acetylase RimI-like enzyme
MVIDLKKDCERFILSEKHLISDFDCGNEDLNDFFKHEAILYKREMLAETMFFRHKISGTVVCACSLSASSIKTADLPANRGRKVKDLIPKQKSLKLYPGILIGRLGVSKDFNGQGVGSQFMDIIKNFCVINFSSYARFLLVDAHNEPAVIKFYEKNSFTKVFSTEEQEKKAGKRDIDVLHTRYMFYDMSKWRDMMSIS